MGNAFLMGQSGGSGNATASDLLSGKTASTDAGDITGTLVAKKYATGTTTSNSSYMVTVSGLNFTPSIVIILDTSVSFYSFFMKASGNFIRADWFWLRAGEAPSDQNASTVWSADGFSVWGADINKTVYWMAIE